MCIDLKSFYASVECVERGLDPLMTNLVVADSTRTEKTICLAVSPSLKKYGISGRSRLFEVVQRVKEVNAQRKYLAPKKRLTGESYNDTDLENNKSLAVTYITAPPRMALYMKYSTIIYEIYLKYIAPEDIHVYSVDEVFIDITHYLSTYKITPRQLAIKMIHDVLKETGITATAGIGTNMYLAKIAMDIEAKHIQPDKYGVRIAELDEISYRKKLWNHTPITDFWRVGSGYAKRLSANYMFTMGDVARCSLTNEDLLYKLFGINAELLIDHAWGYEPCTIDEVKAYKPAVNSISTGQVLQSPYNFDSAAVVVREMFDMLSFDLVDKQLVTDQIVLTIGYDVENLTNKNISRKYEGEISTDRYGRKIPKNSHGTMNLEFQTASSRIITEKGMELYEKIIDKNLLIRRIWVVANKVVPEKVVENKEECLQLDLFTDYNKLMEETAKRQQMLNEEKSLQKAVVQLRHRYGKNAVLKGMNFTEGATAISRNSKIGGHKA